MIITGIIIVLLLLAFFRGTRQGLVRSLVDLAVTLVSALVAAFFYQQISDFFGRIFTLGVTSPLAYFSETVSQGVESPIFAMVAFLLIMFVVRLIIGFLLFIFKIFKRSSNKKSKWERFFGGLVRLVLAYFKLQLLLTFLALLPITGLQNLLADSSLAHFIIFQTPITSTQFLHLFIENTLNITI